MIKKTAVVDMDGVICEEGPTFERSLAREVSGARERLEALRDAGYRIIIHTARSWSELAVTEEWLYERGIFYDQLVMGKPVADILVDDRAVSSLEQAVTVTAGDTSGKPVTESQKQLHEPVALTDEEREAIAYGVMLCEATAGVANDRATIDGASRAAVVLRGLLDGRSEKT